MSQENVEGGVKGDEVSLTATQDRWACSKLRCDCHICGTGGGEKQKE
jgi:hypothetical protein